MSSLLDSFEIYHKSRAIPVRVFNDAKEVYDILMHDFEQRKKNNEKVLLFSDIDETVIQTTRSDDMTQRPLGATLANDVCSYDKGHVAFITARMWDSPSQKNMHSKAWLATFFDLYVNKLHPVVDDAKNSVVLCDPLPHKRMRDEDIDLHIEMFKQKQRQEWSQSKYSCPGKSLWLCMGDNLWDIVGSSRDNPLYIECEKIIHHPKFGKAYFLLGDGKTKLPPSISSKWALLLTASARPKMNERFDALQKKRKAAPVAAEAAPPADSGAKKTKKRATKKKAQ